MLCKTAAAGSGRRTLRSLDATRPTYSSGSKHLPWIINPAVPQCGFALPIDGFRCLIYKYMVLLNNWPHCHPTPDFSQFHVSRFNFRHDRPFVHPEKSVSPIKQNSLLGFSPSPSQPILHYLRHIFNQVHVFPHSYFPCSLFPPMLTVVMHFPPPQSSMSPLGLWHGHSSKLSLLQSITTSSLCLFYWSALSLFLAHSPKSELDLLPVHTHF